MRWRKDRCANLKHFIWHFAPFFIVLLMFLEVTTQKSWQFKLFCLNSIKFRTSTYYYYYYCQLLLCHKGAPQQAAPHVWFGIFSFSDTSSFSFSSSDVFKQMYSPLWMFLIYSHTVNVFLALDGLSQYLSAKCSFTLSEFMCWNYNKTPESLQM